MSIVIMNGVGHGVIQFIDEEIEKGSSIELQYTGYPKIVLKELQILFSRALEKKKTGSSSWATAEYISFFRKEDDSIEIVPESRWGDNDYEYKINCGYDEWIVEYVHNDQRKNIFGPQITVSYVDGLIIKEDDDFWDDCGKKKKKIVDKDTIGDPKFLELELAKLKLYCETYKTMCALLMSGKSKEALQIISLISIKYPELIDGAKSFLVDFLICAKNIIKENAKKKR